MPDQESNSPTEFPADRTYTIGEVGRHCDLQPHVLRYWEQQFPQLQNVTRRNNRRFYSRDDVLFILKLKDLLHEQGFKIDGAKRLLDEQSRSVGADSQAHIRDQIDATINLLEEAKRILHDG